MKVSKKWLSTILLVLSIVLFGARLVQAAGGITIAGDRAVITDDVDGALIIVGNDVVVDAHVKGIVLGSGNNVRVNGGIDGPVFIAGNNVSFNGQTEDLFMAGNTVTIGAEAEVERDAFLAGATLTVDAPIKRDLYAAGDTLLLNADIERDGYFAVDKATVRDDAMILGDLTYSSTNTNDAIEQRVDGEISFHRANNVEDDRPITGARILGIVWSTLGALLSGLLIWWLMNRITRGNWQGQEVTNRKAWQALLVGLGAIILIPIITLIMIISRLFIEPALILFTLFIIALTLGFTVAAAAIERNHLSERFGQMKYARVLAFIVAFLAIYILSKLSYIGWLVSLLTATFALGSFILDVYQALRTKPLA
ncbi:hypothetical protein CL176_09425 [Suicoccus acidiformans]|uniref:Polymer-forming cytoskeletal protein n=1 Tax=Suicoccus acidiformans TaxID=2036206 RepID=A0A347WM93_9LACT|nr:hypothetical protein [Suicoccus acidiformans]AXY26200.1 hypothetical protein CL176_09425 [Suicoccus acidiformans]